MPGFNCAECGDHEIAWTNNVIVEFCVEEVRELLPLPLLRVHKSPPPCFPCFVSTRPVRESDGGLAPSNFHMLCDDCRPVYESNVAPLTEDELRTMIDVDLKALISKFWAKFQTAPISPAAKTQQQTSAVEDRFRIAAREILRDPTKDTVTVRNAAIDYLAFVKAANARDSLMDVKRCVANGSHSNNNSCELTTSCLNKCCSVDATTGSSKAMVEGIPEDRWWFNAHGNSHKITRDSWNNSSCIEHKDEDEPEDFACSHSFAYAGCSVCRYCPYCHPIKPHFNKFSPENDDVVTRAVELPTIHESGTPESASSASGSSSSSPSSSSMEISSSSSSSSCSSSMEISSSSSNTNSSSKELVDASHLLPWQKGYKFYIRSSYDTDGSIEIEGHNRSIPFGDHADSNFLVFERGGKRIFASAGDGRCAGQLKLPMKEDRLKAYRICRRDLEGKDIYLEVPEDDAAAVDESFVDTVEGFDDAFLSCDGNDMNEYCNLLMNSSDSCRMEWMKGLIENEDLSCLTAGEALTQVLIDNAGFPFGCLDRGQSALEIAAEINLPSSVEALLKLGATRHAHAAIEVSKGLKFAYGSATAQKNAAKIQKLLTNHLAVWMPIVDEIKQKVNLFNDSREDDQYDDDDDGLDADAFDFSSAAVPEDGSEVFVEALILDSYRIFRMKPSNLKGLPKKRANRLLDKLDMVFAAKAAAAAKAEKRSLKKSSQSISAGHGSDFSSAAAATSASSSSVSDKSATGKRKKGDEKIETDSASLSTALRPDASSSSTQHAEKKAKRAKVEKVEVVKRCEDTSDEDEEDGQHGLPPGLMNNPLMMSMVAAMMGGGQGQVQVGPNGIEISLGAFPGGQMGPGGPEGMGMIMGGPGVGVNMNMVGGPLPPGCNIS